MNCIEIKYKIRGSLSRLETSPGASSLLNHQANSDNLNRKKRLESYSKENIQPSKKFSFIKPIVNNNNRKISNVVSNNSSSKNLQY